MSIPLPRLSSTGELKPNWVKFKNIWDFYEILTGLKNKEDPVRVATFIGIDFLDIHNNLPYKTEADKQKMEPILKLWDEHAKGNINAIYERHIFNSYVQTDEILDDFIVKAKHYATNCGVVNLKVRNPKNDKVHTIPFNVIQGARSMPLLGVYTSQVMGLIKVKYHNIAMIASTEVDLEPVNMYKLWHMTVVWQRKT